MSLVSIRDGVILLVVIALVGAAGAIALNDFQTDLVGSQATTISCNSTSGITDGCGFSVNITKNGLTGITNTTNYLDTIGTILAVITLVGVVVGGFMYFSRRQ